MAIWTLGRQPGGGPRTMCGRGQANPKAGFTVTREKNQSKYRGSGGGGPIGPMGCKYRDGAGPRGVSNRLWWARRGCRFSGPGIKQGGEHAGTLRGLGKGSHGKLGMGNRSGAVDRACNTKGRSESCKRPFRSEALVDSQVCSGEEILSKQLADGALHTRRGSVISVPLRLAYGE